MNAEFFTDKEYEKAFVEFGDARSRIAERILEVAPANSKMILDFLSGHGFLAAELVARFPDSKIIGTGLNNDVESYKQARKSQRISQSTWAHIQYIACDVTVIPLKSDTCDIVTNFLGLEDLNMTKGRRGVERAIAEIDRISKKDSLIQISFVDYGDSPDEILAKEIWEYIGLNATFYNREDYLGMFEAQHILPIDEFECRMQKKMTAKQAREELLFACEEAPKIFTNFGVTGTSFYELWNKFSESLERHGMSFWSPIDVIIFSKN